MNRKRIIIISTIVIILAGALIIWLSQGKEAPPETQLLQEVPGLPQEAWLRIIASREDNPGYKILTNQYDGYEITVPGEWQSNETATASGGLKAFYNPLSKGIEVESNEGVMLNIITFNNPNNLNLDNWLKVSPGKDYINHMEVKALQTAEGVVYKANGKVFEDRIQGEVPIEKSSQIIYFVKDKEKIYVVMCWAIGDQYEELIITCEKEAIPTFKILD